MNRKQIDQAMEVMNFQMFALSGLNNVLAGCFKVEPKLKPLAKKQEKAAEVYEAFGKMKGSLKPSIAALKKVDGVIGGTMGALTEVDIDKAVVSLKKYDRVVDKTDLYLKNYLIIFKKFKKDTSFDLLSDVPMIKDLAVKCDKYFEARGHYNKTLQDFWKVAKT